MVVIVTGAVGIGKTTVCERVVGIARSNGYSCGGVLTYKDEHDNLVVRDIETGERKVLASTHDKYGGPRTGRYFFSPEGIEFGIRAIDKGIASDILVVDELGHLELRGEGFAKVIPHVAGMKARDCILVIRKELLPAFLPRLKVLSWTFEATLENRDRLHARVFAVLAHLHDHICGT